MKDLQFISQLFSEFFKNNHIKKRLKIIKNKQITGWEKWLQVEFGVFLDDHDIVMESGREGIFSVDRRKDTDKTKIYVDFILRKKNCTKDFYLAIELKQADSFRTCLGRMIDDANKIYKIRGGNLRECFMVGIHNSEEHDLVISESWERCSSFLPSKKRIVTRPIGRTGFSYTIF